MKTGATRSFVGVLGAAMLIGLAVDVIGSEQRAAPLQVEGTRFETDTRFCPPSLRESAVVRTVATAREEQDVRVGIEPVEIEKSELGAERAIAYRDDEGRALDFVGYGGALAASSTLVVEEPVAGGGGAACADDVSDDWYFADGSSLVNDDERLLIYNPFPDEAVVRVTLFTPTGQKDKAFLAELAVAAQDVRLVRLNKAVRLQGLLSVRATAVRGRVVIWKALMAGRDERPKGVQFTLGAPDPALEWYFPDGGIGNAFDERLALLNPSEDEAVVNISLVTDEESVQPPRLVEVEVPPTSSKVISLEKFVTGAQREELSSVGAVVRSTNGTEIVAERTVYYSGGGVEGVASEMGATSAVTSWILGPPMTSPTTDSLIVMNPGATATTVSVRLLRLDGAPLEPQKLQSIRIPAAAHFKIPIAGYGESPTVAILVADDPVVAERFSYSEASGDVGAMMGMPGSRS